MVHSHQRFSAPPAERAYLAIAAITCCTKTAVFHNQVPGVMSRLFGDLESDDGLPGAVHRVAMVVMVFGTNMTVLDRSSMSRCR